MFKWLKDWGEEVKNRFVAVVPGYFGGGFATVGIYLNPAINTVLFDTGALSAGIYDFTIYIASSAATTMFAGIVQHRNAANTANMAELRLAFTALSSRPIPIPLYKISSEERLRFICGANITATIQVSCIYTRRFPLVRGQ